MAVSVAEKDSYGLRAIPQGTPFIIFKRFEDGDRWMRPTLAARIPPDRYSGNLLVPVDVYASEQPSIHSELSTVSIMGKPKESRRIHHFLEDDIVYQFGRRSGANRRIQWALFWNRIQIKVTQPVVSPEAGQQEGYTMQVRKVGLLNLRRGISMTVR